MFATPVRRRDQVEEEEPVIDLIEFGANYSVSFANSLMETPIMVTPENHPIFAFRPMEALPIQRNLFNEVEEEAEAEEMVPPSPVQSVVILSVTLKPRRLFENVIDLTGEEEEDSSME
jgi:hypothetical protein